MWCIIGMNDIACTVSNNPCMLLRNFRREKTFGEMWAAVIRTINNLLRTAWLRTRAPQMGTKLEPVDAQNGTMQDIFASCLKKNIAQVCTLVIHVLVVNRSFNLLPILCKYCWKNQHPRNHSGYVTDVHVNLLQQQASSLSLTCINMSRNNRCLFFRRLKINHESHEFIIDAGTVTKNIEQHPVHLNAVCSKVLDYKYSQQPAILYCMYELDGVYSTPL